MSSNTSDPFVTHCWACRSSSYAIGFFSQRNQFFWTSALLGTPTNEYPRRGLLRYDLSRAVCVEASTSLQWLSLSLAVGTKIRYFHCHVLLPEVRVPCTRTHNSATRTVSVFFFPQRSKDVRCLCVVLFPLILSRLHAKFLFEYEAISLMDRTTTCPFVEPSRWFLSHSRRTICESHDEKSLWIWDSHAHIHRHRYRHTQTQTDRQTDRHTHTHTRTHTQQQNDSLSTTCLAAAKLVAMAVRTKANRRSTQATR